MAETIVHKAWIYFYDASFIVLILLWWILPVKQHKTKKKKQKEKTKQQQQQQQQQQNQIVRLKKIGEQTKFGILLCCFHTA